MDIKEKILAIVVTYNRIDCLKECIIALKNQSYKDFDILVVNNGSIDGTKEYLEEIPDIIVINQENLGGAGGFYAGMKYGYERDYDWFWLMDDDGLPASNQLEELLKHRHESFSLNALVVDKDDHDKLAFSPLRLIEIDALSQNGIVTKFVHPFNGTLYSRELINKIGFIKKEMFIWGDEKEYTNRAIRADIMPLTIISAIHYHPKEKAVVRYPIPFLKIQRLEVLLKPERLSHYYYRNLGYIDVTYRTKLKSLKMILVHSLFFLRSLNFKELKKFYKYYFDGRKNIY